MTPLPLLNYVNLVSAAVIFTYCCYRLGRRQFRFASPELWAHVGLIGGAITIFTYALRYQVIWPQAMFNAAVALYFLLLTACRKTGRSSESGSGKDGSAYAPADGTPSQETPHDRVKTWVAGIKHRA